MDTPKQFNIFYSWQSDLNGNANHFFIRDGLAAAIKELKKENISVVPRIDTASQDKTGSFNISQAIFEKIDACQIFLADITLINSSDTKDKRPTPNPNVLIELGYAVARLGWDRIICLNNDAFSNIKDMPFDIQSNRISRYNFDESNNAKEAARDLKSTLKIAIKAIIEDYPNIINKFNEKNIHQHDLKKFNGLNAIIDDVDLLNLLDSINNHTLVTKEDNKILDQLFEYLKAQSNQYLISPLIEESQNLRKALQSLKWTLAKNFVSRSEHYIDEETGEEKESVIYILSGEEKFMGSYEEYEAKCDRQREENAAALSGVASTYISFRAAIKKNLLI
jgi:hypothetical protein